MNLLLHLVKYNFVFNRIRLIFLSFLSLVLFFVGQYFHSDSVEFGEFLTQYSLYIFFMILTGKMNSKNNLMFDIKHLLAMPLSKREIVFTKSVADVVHFLPISFVFLYGVSLSKPEYHILLIAPIFYGVIVVANMIALNKRVDFSRMQHSRASFKNSFLFLHKYFEMGLLLILFLTGIAAIFGFLKGQIFYLEYAFFILVCIAGFITFSQTLKMLKDETRSYFIVKRDSVRIAWKGAFIVLPLLFFHKVYKDDNFLKANLKTALSKSFTQEIKLVSKYEDKKMLMAISEGNYKEFLKLRSKGVNIPWESEVMGSYPTHLAAMSNVELLNELIISNAESVNKIGKEKERTPLFSAIRSCQGASIEHLIKTGADVHHRDINGDTPLMYAISSKCESAIMALRDISDLNLENNKKYTVEKLVKNDSNLHYLIFGIRKEKAPIRSRAIAGSAAQTVKNQTVKNQTVKKKTNSKSIEVKE